MNILFDFKDSSSVKIRDIPVGQVFSYEAKKDIGANTHFYMRIYNPRKGITAVHLKDCTVHYWNRIQSRQHAFVYPASITLGK